MIAAMAMEASQVPSDLAGWEVAGALLASAVVIGLWIGCATRRLEQRHLEREEGEP